MNRTSYCKCRLLLVCMTLLIAASTFAAAKKLILADFNTGTKVSNIATEFNTWTKDPNDNEQFCKIEFDDKIKMGKTGNSLKIKYDVKSKKTAFNGVWFKLDQLNLNKYRKLTFWLKGDEKAGFTKTFKVELTTKTERGKAYVNKTKKNWKKVSIPLRKFKLKSLRKCDELIITFEENSTSRQEGTIYLDDITFE